MSYDGSSAKSYIRHVTEKERLDNLAFTSFPEDYLPYATTSGQQRATAPPPYLLWGDDRRRRPPKKRRKPKCAGALLCAIALVVVAIIAVVAISVYLGVVTNFFQSPVVSVSGRFLASEEFSEELLNSSSTKFLEKADIYQSKVEKAFLSSSLEPAFIASRVYSFKPGLVVFFRVYLDRRKIKQSGDQESPPTELVRELVSEKLTTDPDSVQIEENEELLAVELRPVDTKHPPILKVSPSAKPAVTSNTQRNGKRPPPSGGVGVWRPIPIEDTVSPSFADRADRPIIGAGSVQSPEENSRKNPAEGLGSARVFEDNLAKNPELSAINRDGVGSVKVLENVPNRNPPLNAQVATGSVRLLEEQPTRNVQSVPHIATGAPSGSRESERRPLIPTDRREGIGSVRLLPDVHPDTSPFSNYRQNIGPVRLKEVTPQVFSNPLSNAGGTGTVRLLDDNPVKKLSPLGNPSVSEGFIDPPTLAPSVMLVVRNRSRTDNTRNLLTRIEKGHQNISPIRSENVGVGSVKEINAENLPAPFKKGLPVISSRLLDLSPEIETKADSDATEIAENKDEILPFAVSTDTLLENQNDSQLLNNENSKLISSDSAENSKTLNIVTTEVSEDSFINETGSQNSKTTLENILFNHPPQTSFKTTETSRNDFNDKESPEPINFNRTNILRNKINNTEITAAENKDEGTRAEDKSEGTRAENIDEGTRAENKDEGTRAEDKSEGTRAENKDEGTRAENKDEGTRAEDKSEGTTTEYKSEGITEGITTEYKDKGIKAENKRITTEITTEAMLSNKNFFENTSPTTKNSDRDVHSSIVNYPQYMSPETHFHTIEREIDTTSEDSYVVHTLTGHGFIKLVNSSNDIAPPSLSLPDSVTEFPIKSSMTLLGEIQTSSDFTLMLKTGSPFELSNQTEKPIQSSVLDSLETLDIYNTPIMNQTDASNIQANVTELYDATSNSEKVFSNVEYINATIDDTSQQAKVVPQMQTDLLSNDIGEESNEENNHFGNDVLRHITTLRPQLNGSDSFLESCPAGSVPCDITGESCGVRCDMRRDCPNNEDEIGCMCADLLRAMGQSQKICDGIEDCSDKSDEVNCPWCPSADYFRCPRSRTCIAMDRVCDGKDDCPDGQDERRCVNLAESSTEADSYNYRSEGYLIVRRSGQWGKLCLDALTRSSDLEQRIRDLGKAVCSALTYRNLSSSVRTQDKFESESTYYQISTGSASNKSSSLFEHTSCKRKEVLRVQCKTLECGLRPSAPPSQRRRIVGGRSADSPGAWPWAVALYREGDFQCGAALISNVWLISAAHCFYSSQQAYWTARLGVLRRGSELPTTSEQVRRIKAIVLHPQYEDEGFINDIALLRLDREVPFSDILRPICLPSSPSEDASLWHGRRCSVVGWGKLYEIGHTFPDSLQEVRLPVISSSECQRRSIFLPAYRITPKMFCAGYDRGGRDACLGDSGGPMACQRPADGRWILLGVTSNGDGCGRPNRPGVYSQVAGFLTWIQDVISDREVLEGKTGSESTCSSGVRCRLGRCISQSRVCDGRRDCATGEDEIDC